MKSMDYGLEMKFCRMGAVPASDGLCRIEGYASVFGVADQGGDVVVAGAYGRSLAQAARRWAAGEDAVAA
jgi:phage head maturation protease